MIGIIKRIIRFGKSVVEANEVNKLLNTMRELAETIINLQKDVLNHDYNDEETIKKMVDLENKVTELDCTVEKIADVIKSGKYKPIEYNKDPWYKYYCNCVDDVRVVTWKYIASYYSGRQNYYMKKCMDLLDKVQDYNKQLGELETKLEEYGNKIEELEIEKEEFINYPKNLEKEPTSVDYLKHISYVISSQLTIAEKVSEFDFNIHDGVYYNRCLYIKQAVFRNMFSDVWPDKNINEIVETLKNHHSGRAILKLTSERDTILIPYITKKYGPDHFFYAIYTNSYDYIYQ